MTRGFEALEAGNFAAAKTAFNSAATLKPNDNSPSVALAQAKEAEILSALNRYVITAEQEERNEIGKRQQRLTKKLSRSTQVSFKRPRDWQGQNLWRTSFRDSTPSLKSQQDW